MSLFVVDSKLCNRDGICVESCPAHIIALKDKDTVPVPIEDAVDNCIQCGHCVAVCPAGALSHSIMNVEDCLPVKSEWAFNPEQVEHLLRSRRSIRAYKDKTVDRELITRMIQVASFAPTGSNTQPVHWRVIYDTDQVQRFAGLVIDWMKNIITENPELAATMHLDRIVAAWAAGKDRICRNAPHMIVAHAEKNLRTSMAACTIALSYLELAAPPLGLGTCWAGYFNSASNLWPPMTEALGLPDGHVSFGAMMVGYPKYKYQRIPLRKEARISWR